MKNINIKSVKERSIIRPLIITIGIVGIFFLGFLLFSIEEKQSTQFRAVNHIPTPVSVVRIPQPSVDTTSWKTYVDPVGKFSFKYPPSGSILVNKVKLEFESSGYEARPNTIELITTELPSIMMRYYPQQHQTSLASFLKILNDSYKIYCFEITPNGGSVIIVGGVSGRFYRNTICDVTNIDVVIVQANNVFYYLTIDSRYENFFDTFLSTISFTK